MKAIKFLCTAIVLIGFLLSACAPSAISTATASVGAGKPVADVVFTGVIENMNGDQWVINGQTIQVDASVLRDGSFKVGDTVTVEADVAADGSVTAQRVESPTAAELAEAATSAPDDSSSSADPGSTPVAGSAPQPLTFDDSGTEATGTVEAITDTSITIGGQTFTFAEGVEIKGEIVPGALVKLHFTVNADGTLSVTEVEIADPSQSSDDNSNDDNGNDDNSNDDNGNDDNSNDDDTDDNSNDDNDDDDSNDDNSNDDDSDDNSGGNSNGN